MLKPRKAWGLPTTPPFYDLVDFYKYVTKTRLADANESAAIFVRYYHGLNLPTTKFEVFSKLLL
jgi:hypothetical protein